MLGSIQGHREYRVQELANRRPELFTQKDMDGDGVLSQEEMQTLVDKFNEKSGKSLSLEDFASRLDKGGDSGVTPEAFESARRMGRHHGHMRGGAPVLPVHSQRLFSRLDQDGDNTLSAEEVDSFISRINEWSGKDLDAAEVFAKVDADEDGMVSRDEAKAFREIIGPPRRHGFGMRHMNSYPDDEPLKTPGPINPDGVMKTVDAATPAGTEESTLGAQVGTLPTPAPVPETTDAEPESPTPPTTVSLEL